MRRLILLLWIVGSLLTTGCISTQLVKEKAQPHVEYSLEKDKLEAVNGKPGYYALLPLTVVGDVATSPLQLGYYLYSHDSVGATATVHGVPIPLR
jgi:hypothetical protein